MIGRTSQPAQGLAGVPGRMPTAMSEETTLFRGSPSQVLNLGAYLLSAAVAAGLIVLAVLYVPWLALGVVAPIGYASWRWVLLRSRVYEVTTERIRVSTGILTRRTDELELYRVEDLTLVEPLPLRLLGRGNIELSTNDTSNPKLVLPAIRAAAQLREALRKAVEERREKKRVRVTEFESGPGAGA
jgi:uncharacterized membrane protein YdbT with pleckstrin-like domain